MYTRRLIYGMPSLKYEDEVRHEAPVTADFRKDVEKPNFDENTFEGKVSINNWHLTRR